MKARILLTAVGLGAACLLAQAETSFEAMGYKFMIDTAQGSAAIVDCITPSMTGTTLALPDAVRYQGHDYPVTELRAMAISGFTGVRTIVLGDNVKRVTGRPVYNCSDLQKLILNADLEQITDGLVYKCPSLTSITVPEANTHFAMRDGTLYNSDYNIIYSVLPEAVGATYTVPAGVKALGPWCLTGQTQMKEVILTEGLEMLADGCLAETGIGALALPSTLRYIGDGVCQDGYIGSITVATANPYMKVDADGFLLSADGKVCYASTRRTGECTVPEGVDSIRGGLCKRMYITSLRLPASVVYIGPEAFERAIKLTTADFGRSLRGIGARAFWGASALTSAQLPPTVEVIGDEAFRDCQALAELDLGQALTSLGRYAFSGCNMLQRVTLPGTLRHWGEGAFMSCLMLAEARLQEGIEEVGDMAFTQDYSLLVASLPTSLRRIGAFAFSKCMALTGITMPAGVTHLGPYCLQDVPFSNGPMELPAIEEIGDNALARLANVTALACGPALRTIGVTGINGNPKMKTLTFDEGLVSIGRAGLGNLPLTQLTLPSTVQEVGYILFGSDNLCLQHLTCLAECPPAFIGEDTWGQELFGAPALGFYSTVTLHVPLAALASYKADPIWGKFGTIVGDATGALDDILTTPEPRVAAVYTLQGLRLDRPQPGLNLLLMSDGSVRKLRLP